MNPKPDSACQNSDGSHCTTRLGIATASRRYWRPILRVFLLSAVFVMPVIIMRGKSATGDEVPHLAAGYSYLATGVIKLNAMHPPLIKELCALPLLLLGAKMPVDPVILRTGEFPLEYQWDFGRRFLFSQNADQLLFWGRVPAVLLSLGLAVLVMLWAGRLWGTAAGLLALALYAFDPTITAHAQFVTTDVGLAFFATLFLFLLRRYLAAPSWQRLLLSGVALGLALGAKFSALFLLPVVVLLLGAAAWLGREGDQRTSTRLLSGAGTVGLLTGVAAVVLWALYFFPADPWFYFRGLQTVHQDHNPDYPSYLMGELRKGGWVYYLLVAWLVKTPLASLLLLIAATVAFFFGKRAQWLDEAFLVVPALAFFIGYSLTADNLGVRYLIPCFPFFFIFTARLAPAIGSGRRWGGVILALLLTWYPAEFAAIWPDHLSYFNQIAGGYRGGTEWLDDSNVDWGQGLIQLRQYLTDHAIQDYRLCYLGIEDPSYYGIRGEIIYHSFPPPGIAIYSAHCVARSRARLMAAFGQGPGNWLLHTAPKAIVGHAYYVYEIP